MREWEWVRTGEYEYIRPADGAYVEAVEGFYVDPELRGLYYLYRGRVVPPAPEGIDRILDCYVHPLLTPTRARRLAILIEGRGLEHAASRHPEGVALLLAMAAGYYGAGERFEGIAGQPRTPYAQEVVGGGLRWPTLGDALGDLLD